MFMMMEIFPLSPETLQHRKDRSRPTSEWSHVTERDLVKKEALSETLTPTNQLI